MAGVIQARDRVSWTEDGVRHDARWRSENGTSAPTSVVIADDRTTADAAYRLARTGTALLWRGGYPAARQMVTALNRRVQQRRKAKHRETERSHAETFHQHRQHQSQRAFVLGRLLIPFDADHTIALRRAPDVRQACLEAYGPAEEPYLVSLRELLGVIGAHEWRRNGVYVPALGAHIHPHYGVFSPVRGEYVQLVADAPLPAELPADGDAVEIGTGTGVLAAMLAQRGVRHVVATDQDPRALACARENLTRLGLAEQVEVRDATLFPAGRTPLVVCNPPWVPARPTSPLERAVYDPGGRMLHGFLNGLTDHLLPGGEGWLVLSDLAEHLGLRSREQLLETFATAGLRVLGRLDARPTHARAADPNDALHAARAAEVTSLWRLGPKGSLQDGSPKS